MQTDTQHAGAEVLYTVLSFSVDLSITASPGNCEGLTYDAHLLWRLGRVPSYESTTRAEFASEI